MERVLSALNVEAKRNSSGEWKARCPKHYERVGKNDRKPSWSINESTGLHGCFSCGYRGNLTSLVTDLSDMDPWAAAVWLREEGMQTLEIAGAPEEDAAPAINFMPTVEDEWHLFKRPPAEARVSRGVTLEAVKYYDVRWKDGGWCLPITKWDGTFIGYQWKKDERVLNVPDGVLKRETLFGLDRLLHADEVVLVESPLDVLKLYDNGFAGVASFGAMVSHEQIDLLVSFCETLVIGMDDDSAGRTQARAIYERVRYVMPSVKFLNYAKTRKRKSTGRHPKDVGDMSDEEVCASVEHARFGAEALRVGLINAEEPQRVRR
jgi:hypothetical protein